MKINLINLDIHSSGNLALNMRQNSFEELSANKQNTRSQSLNQLGLLEINQSIYIFKRLRSYEFTYDKWFMYQWKRSNK